MLIIVYGSYKKAGTIVPVFFAAYLLIPHLYFQLVRQTKSVIYDLCSIYIAIADIF